MSYLRHVMLLSLQSLCCVILCCSVGWYVKMVQVHHGHQQWLVAKWLGLGVTVRVRLFSCNSWDESRGGSEGRQR